MTSIYLGPGDSLHKQIRKVRDAFRATFKPAFDKSPDMIDESPWPREVYSDHLIVEEASDLYRVDYTETEAGISFTQRGEWIKVRQVYAPIAAEEAPAQPEGPQVRRWFGPITLEADGQLPEWIPLHRICNRSHPVYGSIVMTEDKMDQAIANFEAGVLRPDSPKHLQVPIDTRHAGDAACGWIAEMKKQIPYLMGKPAWTERGKQVVLDRQFLYISPVYEDNPERGPIFKEATLTNRDFLKMPPVILDEGVTASDFPSPFVAGVSPESHKALSDQKPTRRSKMTDPVKDKAAPASTSPSEQPTPNNGAQAAPAADTALEEMSTQLRTLQETLAKQTAQLEAQATQLQQAESDAQRAEVRQLTESAAARGVPAFIVETMRSVLLALPRKAQDVNIALETDGTKQDFPNLYAALSHFLARVPAQVPVGQEQSKDDHKDPALEDAEIDEAEARRLAKLGSAAVKEE